MFGRRRRGINPWLIGFWLLGMAAAGIVIWQFNAIQPKVLAIVGSASTPTPGGIEYAQRGDQAFWRGDLDGAVNNYRVAAQLTPANVDVLYELSRVLIYRSYGDVRNLGDIAEAEKVSAQAVQVAPNNSRAHTINCFALLRDGKSSDAVRSCIRAIDLNQANADAHAYLSMAYYDLTRTSAALDEAEQAVQLDPLSIDANSAYARSLAYQGRVTAAFQYYEKAASINPSLEFPYFEMAFFAYTLANQRNDEGQYRIAINTYNAVIQRNPKSVKAYTRLCQTYLGKGDPKQARTYCLKATEIDSGYTQAWRWLGEVYHKSRDYEDAVEALKTCADQEEAQGIPIESRDPTCYYLRGVGYFVMGDCTKAIPILDDVLTWSTDTIALRESRRALDKCAQDVYGGNYKTPTPIPTATPRPTPIL
jgi:tetratricopeptide (TPR) repeat protein